MDIPLTFSPAQVKENSVNFLRRATIALALAAFFSTPLLAQAPYWSSPVQYPYAMGGDSGRESPAATVFNGVVYMVFTSRTVASGSNYYMYEATSADGIHYSTPTLINTASGYALASSNPSLTVYNNVLYLAYNSGGTTNLVSSTNGTTWGTIGQVPTGVTADYSPSIATDGSALYVGIREHVASGVAPLVLCNYTITPGWNCTTTTSTGSNYGPNLTAFGPTIYMSFAWQGNSHTLLYYTWSNGTLSTLQTVTGATTSAAPGGAAVGGSNLYIGYRANDGGHGFYTTSTSGNGTWTPNYYSGYGIGGPPAMFSGLPGSSGVVFALYAANDSSHYMYATGANMN